MQRVIQDTMNEPSQEKEPISSRETISNSQTSLKEWGVLGASLLFYLLFWQAALRIPILHPFYLDTLTLCSLAMVLFITVWFARTLKYPIWIGVSLALSLLITLPGVLIPMLSSNLPPTLIPMIGRIYYLYRDIFRTLPGLQGLLLIWVAVSLGAALARLIRETKMLLPIAIVLALVDLYVVFGGGLVAQANSGKAPAAQRAMASLTVPLTPKIRTAKGVISPPPLAVGFADFLFTALFFACFVRFRIPARKTFYWLCGTLCLYLLAVRIFTVDLPALVPIAAVVIGRNRRLFQYTPQERRDLLIAGLVVAIAMGAALFISKRH